MSGLLSFEEKSILLKQARIAMEEAVNTGTYKQIDFNNIPANLCQLGSSFVTLTKKGELRGCIGSLDFKIPLVEDVRRHAVAAALNDFRFPPVQTEELKEILIEISHLTLPRQYFYQSPGELLRKLRPNIDGVVLRDGIHQATFLPQVWIKIPDPENFLSQLCLKMGAPAHYWRTNQLEILIYQVDEFHESG
jgi:uncharacterized protein